MKSFSLLALAGLFAASVMAHPTTETATSPPSPPAASPSEASKEIQVPCGCWNECRLSALRTGDSATCTRECGKFCVVPARARKTVAALAFFNTGSVDRFAVVLTTIRSQISVSSVGRENHNHNSLALRLAVGRSTGTGSTSKDNRLIFLL